MCFLSVSRTGAVRAIIVLAMAISPVCVFSNAMTSAQEGPKPKPAAKPADAKADPRAADRAGITAMLQSFVKSFESRDPESFAAHWTAEGEFENDQGTTVQGRAALVKAFTAFFAKTPELQAEVRPASLRFVGRDTAVGEGSVTVRKGPTVPASNARFTALLVREEGKWRLAKFSESPAEGPTIADLGWLIGEWKSSIGEGAEIRTTYSWSASKKFIYVDFTLKEKTLALSGKQVIGVDPATGQIHSWIFEADGGVGETDWSRDGEHWVLEADGTLADGRTLTETNVLRRVNDDTLTFQSTNRLLDDEELPDLPPVKVIRVKPAK